MYKQSHKGISRRELFQLAGAASAGLSLGGGEVGAALAAKNIADAESSPINASVPFFERNQAGISTPQQDRLLFAAFDLTTEEVSEVRDLLREWSSAAALMSESRPVGEESENGYLPPEDTGEALGLSPARLTLTFGFWFDALRARRRGPLWSRRVAARGARDHTSHAGR
jgi:deferrochelatase/peroxidase EfeB